MHETRHIDNTATVITEDTLHNFLLHAAMPLVAEIISLSNRAELPAPTDLAQSLTILRNNLKRQLESAYPQQLTLLTLKLVDTLTAPFLGAATETDTTTMINITDIALEQPDTNIDLLELAYLCLSMSPNKATHSREHNLYIDQLYQTIQSIHGDEEPPLLQAAPLHSHQHNRRALPLWVGLISCGIILGAIFLPYDHKLNKTLAPIVYNINHTK